MTRQRSRVVRVGAAGFALAVAGLMSAAPANGASPAGGTSAPGPSSASAVVASNTVTLLTGDVVVLERTADGHQTTTVHPSADRLQTTFQTRQDNGRAYVIPVDAMPLLAAGRLDQELFDVTQLVADGYDDAHVSSIPLIVQYQPSRVRAQAAPALPGARAGTVLSSINATVVRENKAQAGSWWAALAGSKAVTDAGNGPMAGALPAADSIKKVWLDAKVHVTLKDSVPQIGAPQAWAAGHDGTGVKVAILDTGIDTSHPDLAGGKVIAAQNFTTDPDTADHFGHGTHVASIVAGTGAASGGLYKGVAPGASLINAKVLDSSGNGDSASIIAGMQWAAAQGARVANMSLGTGVPVDGTDDPISQAVDEISESTGMLFAIAAGNLGDGDSSIASPGWADDAITVGAVDKSDVLAPFSSRGPRLGDYGIKPDITAPGVDIVAAHAAGTTLGPIVDNDYMQLSGTSMATPHVAGAAAILIQQHPDYTFQQIKDLLISTAKTSGDYSVYQQGGGRVDVARADRQQVFASPGTLDLGYFPFPFTDKQPVTKTVTYHNGGTAGVTLDLSLSVTGKSGNPAPAGLFSLSASSVTVPAGADASVDITVDPSVAPIDLYGGYLVGTAGDTVVHTSVGAFFEQQMVNVTVPAIAHDGRPAAGNFSFVELWSPTTGYQAKGYSTGTPTFRVPPGTYSLMAYVFTMDEPNLRPLAVTMVGRPQLDAQSDMTVTLDARPAKRIDIHTPNPIMPVNFEIGYHRALDGSVNDSTLLVDTPIREAYAVPGDKVTEGDFEFWSKWALIDPPIQMKVFKPTQLALDPLYMLNTPKLDGKGRLPLVYAGFGRPEDYTGLDVCGKMALVSRGAGVTFTDKVKNAADAGAAAVLLFNNAPGQLFANAGAPGQATIPGLTIEQAPGQALVDLLAKGPVTIEYSGTAVSPYEYDLFLPNPGQIAADQTYTFDKRSLAQIDAVYRGTGDPATGIEVKYGFRPWAVFLASFANNVPRPWHRTEWVNTTADLRWWHLTWETSDFDGEFDGLLTTYQGGSRTSDVHFSQIARPGIPVGLTGSEDNGAPAFREGDELAMFIFPWVDPLQHNGLLSGADTATMKLSTGNQVLATGTTAIGRFEVPPGSATYRLETTLQRNAPWWKYSTGVNTTWTFTSSTPTSGRTLLPLVQIGYNLPLDDLNRTNELRSYTFTLDVGHQPGVTGPAIKTVEGWVSFDDGAHWQTIPLVRIGSGEVLATVSNPALSLTPGAVSLRFKATDAAGNSVDQTIIRAYGLKSVG